MSETDFLSDLHYSEKTIVFADVVESVRLIEHDEAGAIRRIRSLMLDVAHEVVPRHGGRLVDERGDGLFIEFPDPRSAVACAMALHVAAQAHNAGLDEDAQVYLRVGIHHADVLTNDKLLFGHGVNLAARLTALADAGGTCASAAVAGQLTSGLDADLEDMGECYLKHVVAPVRVYRLGPLGPGAASMPHSPDGSELRPTVAVLPFGCYEDAAQRVGLGDILADQVIAALSKSSSINVISHLSSNVFRDRAEPIEKIGRSLSANFVVSGRYWTSGAEVHVMVELADAGNSRVVWTQSLADTQSAVLQADSELVSSLVSGISQAIFAVEVATVRSASLPTLQSHTLLLAAISLLFRLSLTDFQRARAALDLLNERAPRHPAPLAWLARWHLFRVVQGWSDDRDRDGMAALSFAKRALDLDPDSSLALTMLGNVHTSFLKDLQGAEGLYERALGLNPNESLAWLQKGNCLSFRGEGGAALSHTEKAVQLSPLDPSRHFYLSIMASAALSAGHFERAIEAAKSSLKLNAEHVSTHRVLAIAQAMSGQVDEARASVRRILTLEPQLTVARFVARSPGSGSGLAETFGRALLSAGLPPGDPTSSS
ncbi:MAG TPA: tetratricopeptide repeat protein [Albitalea sp.]|uniref:adenylate/guanylate cyclase domain-containing protein n=1 Tax=Piscinibacter sp. TaxID=1903157 RepID=UPI002ECFB1F5